MQKYVLWHYCQYYQEWNSISTMSESTMLEIQCQLMDELKKDSLRVEANVFKIARYEDKSWMKYFDKKLLTKGKII